MALQNTGDTVQLTLSRRKGRNPKLTEQQILQLKQFWEKIIGPKFEIIVSTVGGGYLLQAEDLFCKLR